ncbi:MAG: hypothetical protein HXY51_12985 [Nitrospirae bacterium]|nr:hypothetical protein [Nitrospirota bacterium]
MHGFYGRILFVDLSGRIFRIETIPDEILSDHLGGKGLATKLLIEGNPPGVDPLAPENQLIFATGPFCQSRIWGASRYGVFTKSPLTGIYLESYSGGKVPEAIDAAGFDAVVFTGRASRPTVVSIYPDGAKFFDADDLWGADTFRTEEEAKLRFAVAKGGYRKLGAVVIGPAGEKMLRFAVIENDKWRSAGRGGVGAVMGSKLLKAVVDKEQPQLVILGKQSIDGDNNQTGQMLGALAKMAQGTFASKVTVDGDKVNVIREIDGGLWRTPGCRRLKRLLESDAQAPCPS